MNDCLFSLTYCSSWAVRQDVALFFTKKSRISLYEWYRCNIITSFIKNLQGELKNKITLQFFNVKQFFFKRLLFIYLFITIYFLKMWTLNRCYKERHFELKIIFFQIRSKWCNFTNFDLDGTHTTSSYIYIKKIIILFF